MKLSFPGPGFRCKLLARLDLATAEDVGFGVIRISDVGAAIALGEGSVSAKGRG
jgi:hypothetical protein